MKLPEGFFPLSPPSEIGTVLKVEWLESETMNSEEKKMEIGHLRHLTFFGSHCETWRGGVAW